MGNDTFGQCGTGGDNRASFAPYTEAKHGIPVKVEMPKEEELGRVPKVTKIVCGFRHSLAITENGPVYGWGYNNQQQLSHSKEYGDESSPLHAIHVPTRIKGPLEDLYVVNVAAGEEMSMFVAHGKKAGLVYE